ncbi:hypothetical protein A6R68_21689 [Neotoma lepida]|uniref:KRAB domain-containing protein n=1 Tax=Neotoma lepida TaxID=56216 RepID=A0A1A6HNT5_NEOLE|nr:hypothetical protein A6R68_21689 [Neotoma lepida]
MKKAAVVGTAEPRRTGSRADIESRSQESLPCLGTNVVLHFAAVTVTMREKVMRHDKIQYQSFIRKWGGEDGRERKRDGEKQREKETEHARGEREEERDKERKRWDFPLHMGEYYINEHKLKEYFILNLLTFKDVATDFRQEEFGCLDSAERTLPGNHKLKNYTNLVSTALSYHQTQEVSHRSTNTILYRNKEQAYLKLVVLTCYIQGSSGIFMATAENMNYVMMRVMFMKKIPKTLLTKSIRNL